jgi:hypothetical protein
MTTKASNLLHRWPTLVGLAFAAFVAVDVVTGAEQAFVLVGAAAVYLGSAALGKPAAAWPLFFGTFVLILVTQLVDSEFDPTWVMLGMGAVLLTYGLVRGALQPRYALPLQTLAMALFGAVGVIGILIDPVIGGYLVALGLLGHAAWDMHHFRTKRVVSRSLAEFCLVLDATLGIAIIALTNLGTS